MQSNVIVMVRIETRIYVVVGFDTVVSIRHLLSQQLFNPHGLSKHSVIMLLHRADGCIGLENHLPLICPRNLHNPGDADQGFRGMPITDSVSCRSVIPAMPITFSGHAVQAIWKLKGKIAG
jgi:hypothetical protein